MGVGVIEVLLGNQAAALRERLSTELKFGASEGLALELHNFLQGSCTWNFNYKFLTLELHNLYRSLLMRAYCY
jgi:hypothetical protein